MGFFGSFFGSDQADDIKAANKRADKHLSRGLKDGLAGYNKAIDTVEPYEAGGRQGFDAYLASLGLSGDDARQKVQDAYFTDPVAQQVADLQENRLFRRFNAQGMGDSGASRLAAARARLEGWGDHQNRLLDLGDRGMTTAGAQAGYQAGKGDMHFGTGQLRAGKAINTGNALAQSRSIGINNLLGVAGTAAKAFAAFSDVRLKRDIERVGALASGLPVYRFRYLWSDQVHEGVMAHEARAMFPDAVATSPDGYLMVDYARIG